MRIIDDILRRVQKEIYLLRKQAAVLNDVANRLNDRLHTRLQKNTSFGALYAVYKRAFSSTVFSTVSMLTFSVRP